MTDDETTIYQLQKRLSEALAGQAALQRTIHSLEVDKARLERQVEELREAVAALMAPAPSEQSVRFSDRTDDPLRRF